MAMVCTECGKAYEQRLSCPLCGVRLIFHDTRRGHRWFAGGSSRWQQTIWGRLLLGLLLAQGLLYGLRQLLTAVLLAHQGQGSPHEIWASPTGLVLQEGLRLATVLIAGVFAGGGHRQGLLLGALVGAANAGLTLLLQPGPAHFVSAVEIYGQPLLQGAIGALGGGLGYYFWQPLAALDRGPQQPKLKRVFPRRNLLAGHVAWVRVAFGVGIAVAGTLSAAALFQIALDASAGTLGTTDEMQDRFITWEIKTLAILLGGAFAGATTSNGLKQGLVVGLATSVILIGIQISHLERWVDVAALTLVSAFTLSLAGSWFGCQLFPPVIKLKSKNTLGPAPL
jgi:hypothetical protein